MDTMMALQNSEDDLVQDYLRCYRLEALGYRFKTLADGTTIFAKKQNQPITKKRLLEKAIKRRLRFTAINEAFNKNNDNNNSDQD